MSLDSQQDMLFLMPPIGHSQIEAHEIHRSKGLEVRLSLALSTIQVPRVDEPGELWRKFREIAEQYKKPPEN
ncbi:UNVERIFIED_CONTAM: hypothetical protein NCL1_52575 [Trichonephila clavipes]